LERWSVACERAGVYLRYYVVLFILGFSALYAAELAGNPLIKELGVSGISMEGKEVRFGLWASSLFATSTTSTSCGAVQLHA